MVVWAIQLHLGRDREKAGGLQREGGPRLRATLSSLRAEVNNNLDDCARRV